MVTESAEEVDFTWVELVSPTASLKTKVILASILAPVLIGLPFLLNFLNPALNHLGRSPAWSALPRAKRIAPEPSILAGEWFRLFLAKFEAGRAAGDL